MKVLYSRWKCAEAKGKLWSYEVSVKTSTATFLALPRTLPLLSFIENSVEVEASVEAVKASFKVQEASTAAWNLPPLPWKLPPLRVKLPQLPWNIKK